MSINISYPVIKPKAGMMFNTSGYGDYNITIEDLAVYIGGSGGGSTTVTTEDISDASTLGKSLVKISDAESARTLLGAGTSSLVLGTTALTASAGNHSHSNATTTVSGFMSSADKTRFDSMLPSAANPLVAGTVSTGSSSNYARADHVHPAQTNVNVATTLQTGRTFTITGGATGAGNSSFNGSQNIIIDVAITPATTTVVGGIKKISGVEDTSGEDLQAIKTTLNELLANMRDAGAMT